MARCDTCGNDYADTFTLTLPSGESWTFDSFECAAQRAAPVCAHCDVRILGHGVQSDGLTFCCASCARMGGAPGPVDNADETTDG